MKLTKTNGFNQKQFNLDFEQNNLKLSKNNTINNNLNKKNIQDDKIILLPHQQSLETIIINIRDLFFIIIDKLEQQENPIPFILATDQRIFYVSLFLIFFGSLMLLLASLLKSPMNDEK
jgi:hypothetical protein